jgi:hypothetical protein
LGITDSFKNIGKSLGGYAVHSGKGMLEKVMDFIKANMKRVP